MNASHLQPLRCVLFDLDGTLLDTAPDLGAAVNHVLISEGFAPLSDDIIRQTTSHGALGLLKAGLGDELLEELGTTRLRNALLDYYAANLCVGTRPYEGMVDLIEWLDEKQLPWGIVTNKPGFLTEPLLAALPQLASCGVTVSADTLPVRKPDPAPMFFACKKLGVEAAHCLYVGDHVRDIEAGRNAGMRTAVAGWGYLNNEEDPAQWGADLHFDTVQALHHWLRYELTAKT
ncbi:haloacid dehalogenase [Aeromonas veronii]|uniref:HAD family hydrolase n=1 Tax=Aeromonas veronii TaxID=654 RepID=UPI00078D4630|nr:HAD-IA family hydrolase [Aeromonas veronii]AMQ42553.1 haloacid dehalogenase [Aeromonas veronii]MCX0427375.1 HAD-IA family hydrolase [Aeromonas veronii]MCX0446637.1 HAD-IA family hydrolase [Aeromonas veronii]POG20105.1 haloacid dehalogenase [Aeromonas veronii]